MTDTNYPDTVQLRDTTLFDDLGGQGQRIYTTAGGGYKKVSYTRTDLVDTLRRRVKELEESQKTWNNYYRRQHHPRCDLLEAAGTDSLGNKCTCQQCIEEDILAAIKAGQEPGER